MTRPSSLLVVVLAGAAGCAGQIHAEASASAAILVYSDPPPAQEEEVPPAPSDDAVWTAGHWSWSADEEWSWTSGTWVPARDGHIYVQPRWERRGRGWLFVPGHWLPVDEGTGTTS